MAAGPAVRLAVLAGLLLTLAGLGVWFGSLPPAPETGAYPDESELAADYDGHLGDRVVVGGRVTGTDPVVVRVEHGSGETMALRVRDVDGVVSTGDQVRVYGVVEPGGEIRALNVVVVPPWGPYYAVGISALAGLWVLARLGRYWRFDVEQWRLERRTDSLADSATAADGRAATGGEDA